MAESRNLTTLTNIDYSNLPFAPENNIPQTLPPPLTEVIIPDNSHQNLNQVWTGPWTPPPQDCSVSSSSSSVQEPEAVRVIQQPQTSLPLPNIIQPAAPAEIMVVDERRADIRRRNNIAEKDYRRRKKVRRELVQTELKKLERRHIELTVVVIELEESIKRIKDWVGIVPDGRIGD